MGAAFAGVVGFVAGGTHVEVGIVAVRAVVDLAGEVGYAADVAGEAGVCVVVSGGGCVGSLVIQEEEGHFGANFQEINIGD